MSMMCMNSKLSVVYDVTKKCPWNCSICCMGAISTCKALEGELSLERKLSLMDDLAEVNQTRDVHIDFSGGEIFTNMDHLLVIEKAASLLGKGKIGVSTSGFMMSDSLAERLSHSVNDCELTMDTIPGCAYSLRPTGYAVAAANAIPHLQKYGIRTGIQTVLAHSNCTEQILGGLYEYLCKVGIDNWSLLKFYPSGRGKDYIHECLTDEETAWAIKFITDLDTSNHSNQKPEIDFHYTMKGHKKYSSECRCVRKSIGILPDGTVTSCFWAVDSSTNVVSPKYLLGSVKRNTIGEILKGEKAMYWMSCAHKCDLSVA